MATQILTDPNALAAAMTQMEVIQRGAMVGIAEKLDEKQLAERIEEYLPEQMRDGFNQAKETLEQFKDEVKQFGSENGLKFPEQQTIFDLKETLGTAVFSMATERLPQININASLQPDATKKDPFVQFLKAHPDFTSGLASSKYLEPELRHILSYIDLSSPELSALETQLKTEELRPEKSEIDIDSNADQDIADQDITDF